MSITEILLENAREERRTNQNQNKGL